MSLQYCHAGWSAQRGKNLKIHRIDLCIQTFKASSSKTEHVERRSKDSSGTNTWSVTDLNSPTVRDKHCASASTILQCINRRQIIAGKKSTKYCSSSVIPLYKVITILVRIKITHYNQSTLIAEWTINILQLKHIIFEFLHAMIWRR